MKKRLKAMLTVLMASVMSWCVGLMTVPVMAVNNTEAGAAMVFGDVDTAVLPGDWSVEDILKLILNIVVYGLGVAAVFGVVIAGVMYLTARDNEARATAARKRLIEIAIGLVAWAVMYGVLNWLIPGGLNLS